MARVAKSPNEQERAYQSETVVLNVGGRCFEVLRHTIEGRPSTLLASLLDGASVVDDAKPIFVDANPDRFAHVLDWYRYGEMYVDGECAVKAVLRDAQYFMLPDAVTINGTVHALGTTARDDSRLPDARHVGDATKAATLALWPAFDEYVDNLIHQLETHFEYALRNYDGTVEHYTWEGGGVLQPTSFYKDFTIASMNAETGWAWKDGENIRSQHRLGVLVAELRRRGFHCAVRTSPARMSRMNRGFECVMRVGIRLDEDSSTAAQS